MSRFTRVPCCGAWTNDHDYVLCECGEYKCDDNPHAECNESPCGALDIATLEPGQTSDVPAHFSVFARRLTVRPDLMIPNPLALRIDIPTPIEGNGGAIPESGVFHRRSTRDGLDKTVFPGKLTSGEQVQRLPVSNNRISTACALAPANPPSRLTAVSP